MRRVRSRRGWILALTLCGACAGTYEPSQVETRMAASLEQAQDLLESEQPIEAGQFVQAAARIDPEYPGLAELRERIARTEGFEDFFVPTRLGSNRARRIPTERSPAQKVLLYLPDRLVDLVDCLTAELHFGPGAYLDVHVTRGAQVAGGLRAVGGLGTYGNRSILGARGQTDVGLAVLPAGAQFRGGALAGASGVRLGSQAIAGLHRPTDDVYQQLDDYWSVGTSFTLIFGGTLEVHPVQLADFFAGLVGIDFLRDDFATSRGLALSRRQTNALLELARVARSPESLERYRAFRQDASTPVDPRE